MASKKDLEKRIAALELALKSGRETMTYIVDTWQKVLLQFADDYNIVNPELRAISDSLRQKESHF